MTNRTLLTRAIAVFAIAFGMLTLVTGGATLLGARDMGAVVPFVLWFNTVSGLVSVAVGVGLWLGKRWTLPLALATLAATLLVFVGFGLHVARGGAFEMRTVFAMALRSAVWGGLALVARQAWPGR